MQPKNIFILDGHPGATSLTRSLAETYAAAARAAGHSVRLTHLSDLEFDQDFGGGGYADIKPLEPALEQVVDDIEWSDHFVMTAPMWWGGLPARLKGLFDRALLPGRAFDTRNTKMGGMPSPLLTGRTARVILTSDTPGWIMRLFYRRALIWQLKGQIFGFVGFKPVRSTVFGMVEHADPAQVGRWLKKMETLGEKAI